MTFIIAEAGVNHNGDIAEAYRLVDAAAEAGADAVKFQHFKSQRLWGDDRIADLELTDAEMESIAFHCQKMGIEFMCTPFGVQEVEFLKPLLKRVKVASGCLTRWELLKAVRDTKLPVILSTGMSDVAQIGAALRALGYGTPSLYQQDFTLLHCTSAYPCPIEDVNLSALDVLQWQWGRHPEHSGAPGITCKIGYSDHTLGITIAIAAVARGSQVLEKHLTLDRNAEGPDHKASIEPKEFKVMVQAIRTVEKALGDGVKKARLSEITTKAAWYGN